MRTTRARSIVVYILAAVFAAGLGFFVLKTFLHGSDWAVSPINQHINTDSGELASAGKVLDRDGEILAQSLDGQRVYSADSLIRQAMLQTVGDNTWAISTAVQNTRRSDLIGYNFITGISANTAFGTGNNLTLTLDSGLCAEALSLMGDRDGAVVISNYVTGEILCMVSTPTYDPENRPDIENDETGQYDGVFLNKVLSASMTPGSTFKIITCAAAIDNIPDINERVFTCSGEIEVDGEKITCMASHGQIGFEEGMSQSCNIVFAELAMELGKDKMTEEAEKMGFGSSFTIDGVPTLASSYDVSKAETRDLGWSGIGQYTDLVNPMHLNILMGAIANGGVYVTPYYIDSIKTPFGLPTYVGYGTPGERLLKAETADALKDIMRYTVETNYGDSMFPGLTVCAKTGTGEIGEDKNPNGWMTGFTLDSDCPLAFTSVVENSGFGMAQAGPIAQQLLQSAAVIVRGQ